MSWIGPDMDCTVPISKDGANVHTNTAKLAIILLVISLTFTLARGAQHLVLNFDKLQSHQSDEGLVEVKFDTGELGLLGGCGIVFDHQTSSALCRNFGYQTGESRAMIGSLFNIDLKYTKRLPGYKCPSGDSDPTLECVTGAVEVMSANTIENQTLLLCSDPEFKLHFKKLPHGRDNEGLVEIKFSTGDLGLLGGNRIVFDSITSWVLCLKFGYRYGRSNAMQGSFFNINPTYTRRFPKFEGQRRGSGNEYVLGPEEKISDDKIEYQTLLQCFEEVTDEESKRRKSQKKSIIVWYLLPSVCIVIVMVIVLVRYRSKIKKTFKRLYRPGI